MLTDAAPSKPRSCAGAVPPEKHNYMIRVGKIKF